ncbi:hypothetical protein BY996DRAFT_8231754 [Phakopsora pachyrhizi]|nr:hypothetical protein BY996DRAFT_8231754 [Phakopsora pachyrhizi]
MLSTLADLSIFSVLLVLAMAFCGASVFFFSFYNTTMLISFFFFYHCCHLHWLELLLDHLLNMRRMTVQFIR